jgi:hypothetical protein
VQESTYPIRNTPTHTRDHYNTPALAKPYHLLRHRLRTHKHARDIHLEHAIRILGSILQCRRLLLDPRRSNQPVHAAFRVRNLLYNHVQRGHVAHVDLPVCERGVGARGDGVELGGGRGKAIKSVDLGIGVLV